MRKLTNSCSALALYKYGEAGLDGPRLAEFYAVFLEVFALAGLQATYIGIDGTGYQGRFTKVGGKSHKRLLESNFSDIDTLSLVVTPQGSTEPAYDSFAGISISFVRETGELLFYLVADEAFVAFASDLFESAMVRLATLHDWSFGYGFKAPASEKPDFYILGLDSGNLSDEQRRALIAWYGSSPEDRLKRIRNVYSRNLLGSSQLAQTLPNGQTLREFIERVLGSKLKKAGESGLVSWALDSDAAVLAARRQLQQAGLCIELPIEDAPIER